jgi:hypothetical protein
VKARSQELKGHLDVLLLATLEDGPRHGYAVREALHEGRGGRFDLPTGTVYLPYIGWRPPAHGPKWTDGGGGPAASPWPAGAA